MYRAARATASTGRGSGSGKIFNLLMPASFLLLIFAVIILLHSGYMGNIREGFSQKYSLEYYYMDGCGHCVTFNKSGIWDKIAGQKWNNVNVHKYNMKDQEERVRKFKITGFPSIVMVDISGSKEVVVASFEKERTYDNIVAFINNYTS